MHGSDLPVIILLCFHSVIAINEILYCVFFSYESRKVKLFRLLAHVNPHKIKTMRK